MTMTSRDIIIFGITAGYLLHRLIRNALWNEEKELKRFAEVSAAGPWHHSLLHNWVPLSVGLLMIIAWNEIAFGWVWLAFGIFLVVLGLLPIVGLSLDRYLNKPDFDWEPRIESGLNAKVKKKSLSALFFLCMLSLWIYSWAYDVI